MRGRRTMIPREIFASFAKFHGIVSVNDFLFPGRLQELLQAHLCFLRSFCFARIRLNPLGGQVLHHDCISVIVSRFTSSTENFVICFCQVTNFVCARYDSINTSSARSIPVGESLCSETLPSTRLSLNSCSHSGILE